MRRVIGALFILTAPVVFLVAAAMENSLGDLLFFGCPLMFVAGIVLMSQRPSSQEVAEGMVRKDLIGSAIIVGTLVALLGSVILS